MRLFSYLAALTCWLNVASPQSVPPSAYYVQLSRDSTESSPDTLVERAAGHSIALHLRHTFDDAAFHGVSVVLDDVDDVDKLRTLPGVENVFPVEQLMVNRPATTETTTQEAPSVRKRAAPLSHATPSREEIDWNTPHSVTGVDRLHAQGIFGEGVRVAILDTGIDYLHPALGGCFGQGCKVEYGYDFVGDEYGTIDFVLRPKPDPRPLCYDAYHGTHVAGTVGMEVPSNASAFPGLIGVAPRAKLAMYRVIACINAVVGEDTILAALQRAADDGAHVISMSFEVTAWTLGRYSPLPAAVSALKAQGIAVVASAGNYGARGLFNIVLPGGSPDAMAVASVENANFPTYAISDSNGKDFRYGSLYSFPSGEYPVAWAGSEGARSGCSASDYPPASSLSDPTSDYIVAVKQGLDCDINRIQTLALAANYTKIMTYMDPADVGSSAKDYSAPSPVLDRQGFQVSFASTHDSTLSEAAKSSGLYKLIVHSESPQLVRQPGGSTPNNFSSVGPNTDFSFKPDIAAPGGSIISTLPLLQNSTGFGILSGTSMATPYVAGVYALIKSQHPRLSVDEIFDLIKSTAKPVNMTNSPKLSPVAQQGGGLIQAYDAIHSTSLIQPSAFSLVNSWDASLSIDNPTDTDVRYTLAARPASGVSAFAQGSARTTMSGFLPSDLAADVVFPGGDEITIPAGDNKNISFSMVPPPDIEPSLVPLLSGFIEISSSRGEHFTIPYMRPSYSYSTAPVIGLRNLTEEQKANATAPGRDPLSAPQVFANTDKADIGERRAFALQWPDVIIAQFTSLQPVRQYRMDLVRASTNFTPTWYGYDPKIEQGNLTETTMPDNGTVGGVSIVGSVEIQNDLAPQTNYQFTWQFSPLDVTGSRGIDLRKGSYRLLLRWLKYYREEDDVDEWESWMSGVIDITQDKIRG
ncbi:peptidase [Stachybotrys elegans]|uniref:Peptidase n=1 Tax=Stachybotrys elegans TaxID=80388 RepID=A0A8K0WN52_9HYPO|nr:peptidase [Stachybotrys elegans]